MKNWISAGIVTAALAAASTAFAADIARPVYKAPPVVVPVYNWSGFYLGGNVGWAWSDTSFSTLAVPQAGILVASAANAANVNGLGGINQNGFTAGFQAGYNWQVSNWVFGIEGDINYLNLDQTRDTGNVLVGGVTIRDIDRVEHDWYATVRGRIGYAWDRLLVFGTGGVAFVNNKFSRTQAWSFADGCPALGGLQACHVGSVSNTKTGWAVGGGFEYGLTNNWTFRVEYLHLGFDGSDLVTTTIGTNVSPNQQISHFQGNNSMDIVRAAINYKFDWGKSPVVAKY